jgi:hypothetical protein
MARRPSRPARTSLDSRPLYQPCTGIAATKTTGQHMLKVSLRGRNSTDSRGNTHLKARLEKDPREIIRINKSLKGVATTDKGRTTDKIPINLVILQDRIITDKITPEAIAETTSRIINRDKTISSNTPNLTSSKDLITRITMSISTLKVILSSISLRWVLQLNSNRNQVDRMCSCSHLFHRAIYSVC